MFDYVLVKHKPLSSEIEDMNRLFDAFQHKAPLPSKDDFVGKLQEKVEEGRHKGLKLKLEME